MGRLVSIVSLALVPAVAAQAATGDAATRPASTLDEVVVIAERLGLQRPADVGSRLDVDLLHTPAAISIVAQQRLQELGRNTLVEAVRGTPGMISAERPGAAGVFSYRGFAENNGGLLFDGVRVQSSTITMRNYDSFNFARIEVLRGPAGALFGEGAGAGAINFVPRAPTAGPVRYETLLQLGSYEQRRLGAAASGTLSGPVDFVLSGVKADYDTQVDGTSHDNAHVIGALAWRIGERTRATLALDWLDNSVDDAYWGQPVIAGRPDPSLRRVNYNRSPDNAYDDEVLWTRLDLTHSFGAGLDYSGRAWHYQADRTWRNFFGFEYRATVPETVLIRAVEDLLYDHEFYGTRHDLRWNGRVAGSSDVQVLVGFEASRTDFSSPRSYAPNALRPVVDLRNPQPRAFAPLVPPREDARRADIDNLAGFAEALWRFDSGFAVMAGLNALQTRADIARPSAGVAFEQDHEPFNWRLGATWDATPGTVVYAQFGTGGEPASDSVVILSPADRSLRLTSVEQFEIGTKHRLADGRVEVTTAFFHIDKEDIASVSPTAPTELQVGSQTSRGFELALAGRPVARWLVDANLAYVDADLTVADGGLIRRDVRPPNAPEWVANLTTEFDVLPRFTLGVAAMHVSQRFGNNANTVRLDGYTLADAYGRFAVSDDVDVTLRVKNLSDEVYASWATVGFGQIAVYYGAPRTVEAMLRARF